MIPPPRAARALAEWGVDAPVSIERETLRRRRLHRRSPSGLGASAVALLRGEGLLLVVAAFYAATVATRLAGQLNQDGWLALVSGREIARHGLPRVDHVTAWTHGVHWIDQQWLAQLAFYGLAAVGGLQAALVAHAALVAGTFAVALGAARALGASSRAAAWTAVLSFLPVLLPARELRTQSLVFPLFVLTLWILIADARRPSRRVFLVLPVLALWANLHGSVVLGVATTALAGCTFAWQQARARAPHHPGWRLRAIALVLGPVLCLFASPYGFSLAAYYRQTLLNRGFGDLVTEWRPLTFSALSAPVVVLALVSVALLARHSARLVPFERLALVLFVAAAFLALRNMPWLGYAALLVLPRAFDGLLERRAAAPPRPALNVALGLVACAVLVATAANAAQAPGDALAARYPARAALTVAAAARADGSARVFADVHYADWLLWEEPQLRGRVAFDTRFELLSHEQLVSLFHWTNEMTDGWRSAAGDFGVLVVDVADDPGKAHALLREPRSRLLYRDRDVAVVGR